MEMGAGEAGGSRGAGWRRVRATSGPRASRGAGSDAGCGHQSGWWGRELGAPSGEGRRAGARLIFSLKKKKGGGNWEFFFF